MSAPASTTHFRCAQRRRGIASRIADALIRIFQSASEDADDLIADLARLSMRLRRMLAAPDTSRLARALRGDAMFVRRES